MKNVKTLLKYILEDKIISKIYFNHLHLENIHSKILKGF